MAQTPFYDKRKWAGYLSGYRIFPAIVALFIVPFGGVWHIPTPWDGEIDFSARVVLVVAAIVFGLLAVFVKDLRTPLTVLTIIAMGLALLLEDDRWHIGGVDDFTVSGYMILFVLTALAPLTDVLDGRFAAKYPQGHEEDYFIWNSGKEENDNPNAFFFILVPVALVLRFFFEQLFNWDANLDPDYMFWGWVILAVILTGGTLLFNSIKKNAIPAQAEVAEVLQGWLAGLFYFLIPLTFAVLAFGHWSWVWQTVVYGLFSIGSFVLVMLAQDRWFDRPESRAGYTGTERY